MQCEARELIDQPPLARSGAMPATAYDFIQEGFRRAEGIRCFHYVPSNYDAVWAHLDALERTRFREWGSGMGIATGLAEMLGFEASGVEIDAPLAESSRELLSDFGLEVQIETGSYMSDELEVGRSNKLYFVYCWPGQVLEVEQRFAHVADRDAQLLMYYGPKRVRRIAMVD
jgi:hypothetical protein